MDQNNQAGKAEKKVGPIVATLIIVLILIIVALYLFASKVNPPATPSDTATEQTGTAVTTQTDVQNLQNDLNNATNGLDQQNF